MLRILLGLWFRLECRHCARMRWAWQRCVCRTGQGVSLLLALSFAVPLQSVTPGVLRTDLTTTTQICAVRWGTDSRSVTVKEKRQVFAAYGIAQADRANYQVDHRIARSAGGADVVGNLWAQLWSEARKKDQLEILLHKRVCVKKDLALQTAQQAFFGDWRVAYRWYIGELR